MKLTSSSDPCHFQLQTNPAFIQDELVCLLFVSDHGQGSIVLHTVVHSHQPGCHTGHMDNLCNGHSRSASTQGTMEDEEEEDGEKTGDLSTHVFIQKASK